jgi:uncharacterized membrane protein YczE
VLTDAALVVLPAAPGMIAGAFYYLAGIGLLGLSSGMYLGARLGAGPRDALMTALAARSGWSISRTRTAIELSVLALGWMMGGTLGVGTVLFAVAVGPSVQWGMRLFGLVPRSPGAPAAAAVEGRPAPAGASDTPGSIA